MPTSEANAALWIPALVDAWRRLRGSSIAEDTPLGGGEIAEIASRVSALSQGLTRDRGLAGADYMEDSGLLGAYLLFYWPRSYAQARSVLGEVPGGFRRVLDLGAGPGPVSCAAADLGATELTLVDRSPDALKVAEGLLSTTGAEVTTLPYDLTRAEAVLPQGPFDLITLSHVLNELWRDREESVALRARLVERLVERLAPGGHLVVLEPALRETSRELLAVRDTLVEQGFPVIAPCFWQGACPALAGEGDWCHATRAWEAPPLVRQVADAASLHHESVKMSYLILGRPERPWPSRPAGRIFRIVSEPLHTKGRLRYFGCGLEGRHPLVLKARDLAAHNRDFESLDRGDVVRIGETVVKGDGLCLTREAPAERLSRAGEAAPGD